VTLEFSRLCIVTELRVWTLWQCVCSRTVRDWWGTKFWLLFPYWEFSLE